MIAAIDQHIAHAGGAHFAEGDFGGALSEITGAPKNAPKSDFVQFQPAEIRAPEIEETLVPQRFFAMRRFAPIALML